MGYTCRAHYLGKNENLSKYLKESDNINIIDNVMVKS